MGERTLEDLFQAINRMDTSINDRMKAMEDGLSASVKTLAENLETKFQLWEDENTFMIGKQRELEQRIHDLERREEELCNNNRTGGDKRHCEGGRAQYSRKA